MYTAASGSFFFVIGYCDFYSLSLSLFRRYFIIIVLVFDCSIRFSIFYFVVSCAQYHFSIAFFSTVVYMSLFHRVAPLLWMKHCFRSIKSEDKVNANVRHQLLHIISTSFCFVFISFSFYIKKKQQQQLHDFDWRKKNDSYFLFRLFFWNDYQCNTEELLILFLVLFCICA